MYCLLVSLQPCIDIALALLVSALINLCAFSIPRCLHGDLLACIGTTIICSCSGLGRLCHETWGMGLFEMQHGMRHSRMTVCIPHVSTHWCIVQLVPACTVGSAHHVVIAAGGLTGGMFISSIQ
jgi:hypothetical protein